MDRIDRPGNVLGHFSLGDPAAGIKATQLGAEWPEGVQEELIGIIEGAGITPSKANNTQLAQALTLLSGGGVKGTKKNLLANSSLRIWQRGTSRTVAAGVPVYTADRWRGDAGAAGNVVASRATHAPGTAPDPRSGNDYLSWNQTASATTNPILEQRTPYLEQADAQSLVLSVYLRVATGTRTVTPRLRQNFGSGGSADVDVTGAAWTVTTTWTRFSVVLTPASIVGKTLGSGAYLSVQLLLATTATFTLDVACPQLEIGTIATFFELPAPTEELAECWRYYFKTYDMDTSPGAATHVGCLISGHDVGFGVELLLTRFPVEMRTTPAITWWSPRAANISGAIEHPLNTDNAVTATVFTSTRSSGYPNCTVDPGGATEAWAHITASAEL